MLVYYKADLIIISLKINFFSPCYSWKIAELVLKQHWLSHLLTQLMLIFNYCCSDEMKPNYIAYNLLMFIPIILLLKNSSSSFSTWPSKLFPFYVSNKDRDFDKDTNIWWNNKLENRHNILWQIVNKFCIISFFVCESQF